MTKLLAALALPCVLAACVVVPDAPNVAGTPRAEGTAVALGQPVTVGSVAVTPVRVVEDSRCPASVQCVWEGRLVVETRIDGAGWRDTTNITLGESYGTHGSVIALTGAEPVKRAEGQVPTGAYRFIYEAR